MQSSSPSSLFDTPEDKAARHAYAVLQAGHFNGAELQYAQRKLLRELVECRGLSNAKPIRQLIRILDSDARAIKSNVHDLREVFGIRIGSSREEDGGFYLITNEQEAIETARPLWNQALAMQRVVLAILEPHELQALERQMRSAREGKR